MIIPIDKARIDKSRPPVPTAFKHEGEWAVQVFSLEDILRIAVEDGPLLLETDDDGKHRLIANYIP